MQYFRFFKDVFSKIQLLTDFPILILHNITCILKLKMRCRLFYNFVAFRVKAMQNPLH